MIKKWLALLARYPRLRILLVIVLVIVVIIAVTHLLPSSPAVVKNLPPPSQVVTTQVNPQETNTVGVPLPPKTTPNADFFTGLFGKPAATPAAAKPATPSATQTAAVAPQVNAETAEREQMERYFAERQRMEMGQGQAVMPASGMSPGQYQEANALAHSMQSYVNSSSHSWGLPGLQTVQGDNGSGFSLPGKDDLKGLVAAKSVMIKAGDIEFAVLDTALSSDQPGTPVLAHIVTGKFNGARLMGTFSTEGDKLVVRFTMMSMPQWPSTIAINAYAIDARTGHNALASNVDHHYLVRYGSLIAAAFLQGFGNAYNTASTNTTGGCAGSPVCISTYTPPPAPTARNASYQALGQVGTNLSAQMGAVFNTPPTITLDQGTGIGILFMQDLSNPGFSV